MDELETISNHIISKLKNFKIIKHEFINSFYLFIFTNNLSPFYNKTKCNDMILFMHCCDIVIIVNHDKIEVSKFNQKTENEFLLSDPKCFDELFNYINTQHHGVD